MKVFVINGAPRSGKTTFANLVKDRVENCVVLSTIDEVKNLAYSAGWDGTKTPENRRFLSGLKKVLTEWNDHVVKGIESNIKLYRIIQPETVFFIDCREPDEIEKLCTRFDAQAVLVRRREAEIAPTSNASDADVLDYQYDIIVDNNDTLEVLNDSADTFVREFC